MLLSKINWTSLYKFQDEILLLLRDELSPFYLTGGTALSRYYLSHRYSEDLDFFCHDQEDFEPSISQIARTLSRSKLLKEHGMQISETYARFFVGALPELKIDFVYENVDHIGTFKKDQGVNIDNPKNILANKICCILGRDEPKDVFDIISIAQAYSFNWREIIQTAKSKQILDETDVAKRLVDFPLDWLVNVDWVMEDIDMSRLKNQLRQIVYDLLTGADNTLGIGKPELPFYIE